MSLEAPVVGQNGYCGKGQLDLLMCFLSYLLNVRLGKGAYAVVRNMKDEKVWKMPSCNIHMLEPLLFKLLSAKLGMQLWTQLCNLRYFFPPLHV